jgi:hypothetical protein
MEVKVSWVLGILLTSCFGCVFVSLLLCLIFVLLNGIVLRDPLSLCYGHQTIKAHHDFTTRNLLMDRVKSLRVAHHFHPDIYELFYSSIQFGKRLKTIVSSEIFGQELLALEL